MAVCYPEQILQLISYGGQDSSWWNHEEEDCNNRDTKVKATCKESKKMDDDAKTNIFLKFLNFRNQWAGLGWFVGDAPKLWAIHDGQPWTSPLYLLLKTIESIMRGFGQVCFANNPWSGLLIFVGLILAHPFVGLASFVASVSALCMSRILSQPDSAVVAGLQNYSAVLVGSATISLYPIFFDGEVGVVVWILIVVMAAFSVCIGIGLGVLLSPNKLPVYTLPFNIATSLMFLSLHSAGFSSPSVPVNINSTIEWDKVFEGVLKSSGQVYAIDDIAASSLILVALFINSPFLTVMSFTGGLLSSLVGLFMSASNYGAVYAGVWGYNGFLAAGCIAFFVCPGATSIFVALLNAVFAAFIQGGIVPVFSATKLPVFTFPFCLTSLLFLALAEAVPTMARMTNLTFPEEHLGRYLEAKRNRGGAIAVDIATD